MVAKSVVYILGPTSKWINSSFEFNELRYSLRSLERLGIDFGKVFVIGENIKDLKRGWYGGGIENIIMDNEVEGGCPRETKIWRKLVVAANTPEISEDFIFMNDDNFFRLPTRHVPFYFEDTLEITAGFRRYNDSYKKALLNTHKWLSERSLPVKHFDVHYPMVLNKKKILQLNESVDWLTPWGYVIKSMYCNFFRIDGDYQPDCKVKQDLPLEQMEQFIKSRPFWSIGDEAIPGASRLLPMMYPDKSRWEI